MTKAHRKTLTTMVTILFAIALMFSMSAKTDDLVIASVDYVDAKISELRSLISSSSQSGQTGGTSPVDNAKITELETALGALQKDNTQLRSRMDFLDTIIREMSDNYGFQVLHVYKGDIIYALGTSELILRTGSAQVIGNENNEGLSDVTSGLNLSPSSELSKDHLVIIPRGDGRGIKITSDDSYIMYRGAYSYVTEDGN